MEHLGVPEEYRSRATTVPYLGIAPRYDNSGLLGFPERHGYQSEVSPTPSERSFLPHQGLVPVPFSLEFIESFFQEWLWFGMLHEFALVCGLPLDLHAFIKTGVGGQRTVNTETLLPYVRSVAIDLLIQDGVPLDLKVGDWVYIKKSYDSDSTPSNDAPTEMLISRASLAEPESQDPLSETRSAREKSSSPPGGSQDKLSSPRQIKKRWGDLRYAFDPDEEEEYAWNLTELVRVGHNCELADRSVIVARYEGVPLKILISLWRRDTRASSKPEFEARFSRFGDYMREARRMMWLALLHYDPILRLEISYSIDVLCSNLVYAVERMFEVRIDEGAPKSHYYNTQFVNRMKVGNWCLARTDLVLPSNTSAIYFKSMLLSYESRPHMECTTTACSQQTHDVNSLHSHHDPDNCDGNCQVLSFDEQKLISVLEADGTPGLSRHEGEGGKVDFQVVDVTGKNYVCISHVWSHGLGNPTQNALPLCQIERLFRYIRAIGSPNVILWIDTLSVPINLKYKRLAITRLREVYEKAHSVLVINHHLIRVGTHILERRLQLLCSEWMRRLWTLQEGRLATRLYIQFRHGVADIQELSTIEAAQVDSFVFQNVNQSAARAIRRHFAKLQHITRRFVDLVYDMSHRSVTVPTDEPICLATMLGLSLEMFKSYPTMIDIYRSLPVLPPDLLFLQNPRLDIPGFRWAPSTFLNQEVEGFDNSLDGDTASLMEEGLRIKRHCIIFKSDVHLDNLPQYCVREASGVTFLFYRCSPMLAEGSYSNAGIILNSTRWRDRTPYIWAVLVDNLVLRDGIFFCRFQRNLTARKWNGLTEDGDEMVLDDNAKEYTFEGEFQEDVTFCVD